MIDAVALDTDVVSFFAKEDTRSALYEPATVGKRLCVCFQTIAELRDWEITHRWGQARQNAVAKLLRQFVVLPYDSQMAQDWAEVTSHRRRLGKPIECGDAWIAAAAIRHGLTLLTHNGKHFADIPGLSLYFRS